MGKIIIFLFLAAAYSANAAPIGSPTGKTGGVLAQSDCSAIRYGLCLDSDNGHLYAWDSSAAQEIARPTSVVSIADPGADKGYFWDESKGASGEPELFTATGGLEFSATNLQLTAAITAKINDYHQTANFLAQDVYANAAGVLVLDPKTTRAITVSEIYVAMDSDPTAELTFSCYQKAAGVGYAAPTAIGSGDTVAGALTINSGFTDATIPAGSKIWCVVGDDPDDTSTVELSVTGGFD